ncbi:Vi polysaccharide biosynthesis UDP-N-acetylglucosamine C-6 dehydrogenase TviB [Alphaproteobacteria bacterium]|nr:Vi polysaccharide biosynthesis UDP-N-acetylglucosamine C-6 dehydrogenase TviB [Alphaproteobacteria bacterium]
MKKIAIIGLGYTGLPLAVEFGKKSETIGYDISKTRVDELKNYIDTTLENSEEELKSATHLRYTTNINDIKDCKIFIITVPTPIDSNNKPDFSPLLKSSESLGAILKKGDIVIYESTVYPGATEEICVPVLEKKSGLLFNRDFYCGYSPERINPGDKAHRLTNIKKVTSGSTPEIAIEVDNLYKQIIVAGTHKARSIKIAEAAKVIENTQRDVNIALINELSIIFNKLDIDTEAVLEAASTKWNFIPFKPGLVGGHCIGVDPYYLTHKAIEIGYNPEMILAGRKINDSMGSYVAIQFLELMKKKNIEIKSANILIMGITFKENCPDLRNSKVFNVIEKLKEFKCNIEVFDPWVNKEQANQQYALDLIEEPSKKKYDSILLAVKHNEFRKMSLKQIKEYTKPNHVIYDVMHLFDASLVDGRL